MVSVAPTPTSLPVSVEGTSTIGRSSSHRTPKPFSTRPPKKKSLQQLTPASIPSRYQTYFLAGTEKKGFNSQAPRFFMGGDANENPGPGKYEPSTNNFETQSSSFSKKGTGGFASKSHRFRYGRKQMLGPGSYDPRPVENRVDFNKTEASSNFKLPIASKQQTGLKDSPAPNTYNLSGVHTGKTTTVAAEAAFKSKTKREVALSKAKDNPAPCQYTIKDNALHPSACAHKSVFNSKSKREPLGRIVKGPGPADYKPALNELGDTSKFGPPKQVPYYRQKHYLCISAPAMPLPPLPPPPGPGHYETQDTLPESHEKKLVSAAVFKSTTSRMMPLGLDKMDEPGPGAYNPVTATKQSYLYNINRKWI